MVSLLKNFNGTVDFCIVMAIVCYFHSFRLSFEAQVILVSFSTLMRLSYIVFPNDVRQVLDAHRFKIYF